MTRPITCNDFRELSGNRQPLSVAAEIVNACLRHAATCPWCQEWLMVEEHFQAMPRWEQLELKRLIAERTPK